MYASSRVGHCARIIVCTSPGNRYQRRISISSCGGLFQEKKAFHLQTSSHVLQMATRAWLVATVDFQVIWKSWVFLAGTLDAANSVSFLVCLAWRRKQEKGRWHCRVLRSFSGTPQGYVSQIQRPIFSWNPWLGDRSVYWTQYWGTNSARRGTCKFAKWRGSETKIQNLLPSLLDANSDPKTLPNPVFHCFSDILPGWEGIQRCVPAPHQTKKQTHHNRAW